MMVFDIDVTQNRERQYRLSFLLVFFTETFFQFGTFVTLPIISSYAVFLGASVVIGGLLAGANAIASLAMRLFSGFLSDNFNRKILLIASGAVFVVSAIGCIVTSSLYIIGICRVLQGIAFAIKSVVVIALVSEMVPEESLASGISWISVAYILASIGGPLLGAEVAGSLGYFWAFLLAGALFSIGLCLCFLLPIKGKSRSDRIGNQQRYSKLLADFSISHLFCASAIPLAIVTCLTTVTLAITNSFILLIANERNIQGASLFFLVQALVMLLSRPLAGKACDKFGIRAVYPPLAIVHFTSMIVLVFTSNTFTLLASAALSALGHSTFYPLLQAESIRGIADEMRGRASNTFYIGPDIGMGFGPILGGFVLDQYGISALFTMCAVFTLFALILFFFFQNKKSLLCQGGLES